MYVFWGSLNNDEGVHLYASNLVYEGKLLYLDFAYTQAPLFPYLYGIPQFLLGPNLYLGRLTSLLWGILGCLIVIKIVENLAGPKGAALALALICFNPYTIYISTIIKPYVLTSCLMLLSFYFLTAPQGKPAVNGMLAVFFMGLAVGVRILMLPLFILLLAYLLYREREQKQVGLLSAAAGILTLGLIFFPFFLADKEALWFNLIDFHLLRADPFKSSVLLFNKLLVVLESVNNFFVLMVLLLTGLVRFFHKKAWGEQPLCSLLYLSIFSLSALHFFLKPTYTEYQVIWVPLAAVVIGSQFDTWQQYFPDPWKNAGFPALIIFMILLTPFSQGMAGFHFKGNKGPIAEVEAMADYIEKNTPARGELLAFSTFVAIPAHRKVSPGLEMSIFSYFPHWPRDKAEKYKIVNRHLLNQYIQSQKASAIFLTSYEIKYLGLEKDILNLIEKDYYLAKSMPDWGAYEDTAYLYLPKTYQPTDYLRK